MSRVFQASVASVYPLYVAKVEKKGRTQEELQEVLAWLTGFDGSGIQDQIDRKTTFAAFFSEATVNPLASEVKGVICGYRIEELDNALTRQVRVLDKLVDELAKGRAMEKILRRAS